jgi:hypothetical protein
MMGGGFIGQMHQTNKQNRELVKSIRRKPSEPPLYNKDPRKRENSINPTALTEDDKLYWQRRARLQEFRDNLRKIVFLITAIVITGILWFLFYAELMDDFIEFWGN